MPIYEYACSDCGQKFEALVRSSTIPECPSCHSKALEKQLSVFATTASGPDMSSIPQGPCGTCPNAVGAGGCSLH
jgi:putative FmdB family regulatory protein